MWLPWTLNLLAFLLFPFCPVGEWLRVLAVTEVSPPHIHFQIITAVCYRYLNPIPMKFPLMCSILLCSLYVICPTRKILTCFERCIWLLFVYCFWLVWHIFFVKEVDVVENCLLLKHCLLVEQWQLTLTYAFPPKEIIIFKK